MKSWNNCRYQMKITAIFLLYFALRPIFLFVFTNILKFYLKFFHKNYYDYIQFLKYHRWLCIMLGYVISTVTMSKTKQPFTCLDIWWNFGLPWRITDASAPLSSGWGNSTNSVLFFYYIKYQLLILRLLRHMVIYDYLLNLRKWVSPCHPIL